LLRIFIRAAYGAADERKTVDLNRTILTHAAEGVLGEWGEKVAMGRILRYRLRVAGPPALDAYGSINKEGGAISFDYAHPDTWKSLSKFDYFTELDARLTLKLKTRKEAEGFVKNLNENVLFTWIFADENSMFVDDVVNSPDVKQNSEAIGKYLEERIPAEYWEKGAGWHVLGNISPGEKMKLPPEVTTEPFDDMGFRLLAVTGGQLNSDYTDTARRRVCVEVEPEPVYGRKSKLDILADIYKYHYMILVASYRKSAGSDWTRLPVYVKLGDREDEKNFFREMVARFYDAKTTDGRTFQNTGGGYGTLTIDTDEANRRYFKMSGQVGSGAAHVILLKFAPGDFAHTISRDAPAEKIFYGPTNYALYFDLEAKMQTAGGFGVLLSGSRVNTSGTSYRSGGYVFQYDPWVNGFHMRYFGFSGSSYGELGNASWGVRQMYFYDAAKADYPAPGEISFFTPFTPTGIGEENFNENAGAASDATLHYRLPFSAGNRNYINDIAGDTSQNRNDRFSYDNVGYGTMSGMSTLYGHYSPKHMQSWHRYLDVPGVENTKISEMLGAGEDSRLGFLWDRSWHIYYRAATAADKADETWQKELWLQRHIYKLTVLEVTRNITPDDVEDEWGYKIHHDGGSAAEKANPVHQEGDMFVRLEMIQLKKGMKDWNNSRYYVYSKPVWYGKFKGDAWRGDDPSPFKKLGNAMQHIVADPEPQRGDAQSFRRRGMRVRSWKEAFLGWDFGWVENNGGRYDYVWRNFVKPEIEAAYNENDPFGIADTETKKIMPPDFFETVYSRDIAGQVDADRTGKAHSVWTPPTAIKMYGAADGVTTISQAGDLNANTFGQYYYSGHYVERETKEGDTRYNGKYSDRIYGRLSLLRPWRASPLPNQTTPIFGLYAMRGWDYGSNGRGGIAYDNNGVNEKAANAPRRFLKVVQGLQMPYKPSGATNREPSGSPYTAERDRTIGFRFWMADATGAFHLYDSWIGEGFSPREVRAILGLREKRDDETEDQYIQFIRGTYVGAALEGADFYVPVEEDAEEDE
jgi:hypothetical protein